MNELEILERLIAFDTVSRDSNTALIDYVRDYLAGFGVASTVLASEDGRKANLFATIGPSDRPGVVLSGHTDVVPIDGQTWTRPPFRLTRENGRVYGRGTTDMKGFIACALALVPRLVQADLSLPIHLAFSYDEEVGCYGVHGITRHLRSIGLRPLAVFVGEPTGMAVVNGHKGSCGLLTQVEGFACHSSRVDQGVNAIFYAMDLIQLLRQRGDALAATPEADCPFDLPFTSVSVGVIHGGTARNAIPGDCAFQWDIRATRPGVIQTIVGELQAHVDEVVLPKMRQRFPQSDITTEIVYDVPPLLAEPDGAAESLAKRFAGRNATETVSYGSEAGIFQAEGIPTIICGPGDIKQAHVEDEWVEVAQLQECMRFLGQLADHATASKTH